MGLYGKSRPSQNKLRRNQETVGLIQNNFTTL